MSGPVGDTTCAYVGGGGALQKDFENTPTRVLSPNSDSAWKATKGDPTRNVVVLLVPLTKVKMTVNKDYTPMSLFVGELSPLKHANKVTHPNYVGCC